MNFFNIFRNISIFLHFTYFVNFSFILYFILIFSFNFFLFPPSFIFPQFKLSLLCEPKCACFVIVVDFFCEILHNYFSFITNMYITVNHLSHFISHFTCLPLIYFYEIFQIPFTFFCFILLLFFQCFVATN